MKLSLIASSAIISLGLVSNASAEGYIQIKAIWKITLM